MEKRSVRTFDQYTLYREIFVATFNSNKIFAGLYIIPQKIFNTFILVEVSFYI